MTGDNRDDNEDERTAMRDAVTHRVPKPQEPGRAEDVAFSRRVPDGDNLARDICDACGFIDYVNPRIVVGSVVEHDGRILMCRRSIEPRRGFWTLPAGFMEQGETTEDGARREEAPGAGARLGE